MTNQKPRLNLWRPLVVMVATFAGAAPVPAIEFDDVTSQAGINFFGESYGASWGDVNNDGYPDLFANHHRMLAKLYVNQTNGTFTEQYVSVFNNRPAADHHAGAWGDYDSDGDQDLFVSTGFLNDTQFLWNDNGVLKDRTAQYGLELNNTEGRMPVWHDYNRDGHLDFVLGTGTTSQVWRQSGGSFLHQNSATGFNCNQIHIAQLSDLNLDGIQELICGQTTYPFRIYNQTTVPFGDMSGLIPSLGAVNDAAIVDFNNDLRPDILRIRGSLRPSGAGTNAASDKLEIALSQGHKGVTFVTGGVLTFKVDYKRFGGQLIIRVGAGGNVYGGSQFTLNPNQPVTHGLMSYDPATDPDIYIGYNPGTSTWTIMQASANLGFTNAYLEISSTQTISNLQKIGMGFGDKPVSPNMLFNEPGGFVTRTGFANLTMPIECGGLTTADFDNDMDLDIYVTCRTAVNNIANRLYENNGNGSFQLVSNAGGAAGPIGLAVQDNVGAAENAVTADYDLDGDIDLFVMNGNNMRPFDVGGPQKLYENKTSNNNHWVQIDLRGTTSNIEGIGAKVIATAGGVQQLREQNGGYHRWSQNHQRIHFGLAGNNTVNLRVEWPSGTVNVHNNVPADALYRITEGGGIELIKGAGVECGQPGYDPATEPNIFLWRNCSTNEWFVRVPGGGVSHLYSGRLLADANFSSVEPYSIESGDVLDTSDPQQITYALNTSGSFEDGFDFRFPNGANVCFLVNQPEANPVLVGAQRTPVSSPFDLITRETCDPGLSLVNIDDVVVNESDSTADFTLSLSPAAPTDVTVAYTTTDDDATAGADYTFDSGQRTFTAGETTKSISIGILEDPDDEPDERFSVDLSLVSGDGQIGDGQGFATITDNDGMPVVDIDDPSANESASTLEFTVTLTEPRGDNVTMNYTTAGGTATEGDDYEAASGQLTFDPGETEQTISVTILDDLDVEGNETFTLTLSNISANAVPGDTDGLATILDDEVLLACGQPSYSNLTDLALFLWSDCNGTWFLRASGGGVTPATVFEGEIEFAGAAPAPTPFALEGNDTLTTQSSSIFYNLRTWNTDHDGFNFPDGAGCFKPVASSVPILLGADKVPLSTSDMDLQNGQACDVVPPDVTIDDVTVGENSSATFTVNVSPSAIDGLNIDYSTRAGSADENIDYTATTGTVGFLPGESSKTITIDTLDDFLIEGDEAFFVDLSIATGSAILVDGTGDGTIQDDDVVPTVTIADEDVVEGFDATFTVSASPHAIDTLTVSFSTSGITATEGVDYEGASGSLVFAPGESSKEFSVTTNDDLDTEPDETFDANILIADGTGQFGNSSAVGTIRDNEMSACGAPTIDYTTDQEAFLWQDCGSGVWSMLFTAGGQLTAYEGTVTSDLGFSSATPVSVESNDTFNVGPTEIEYELSMWQVYSDGFDFSYQPGANVCVNVDMPAGTVVLFGPERAPVAVPFNPDTLGPCTSGPPRVSVNDVVVQEDAGVATFIVSLTETVATPVTVDIATEDESAMDGADYTGLPPTQLTIAAGQVSATRNVDILDDSLVEGDETFGVLLSNVSGNAELGDARGTGTIRDDETSVCGEPPINLQSDREAFLWRDCNGSGEWFMRFTAGGSYSVYVGSVSSSTGITNMVPFSIEPSDVLNVNGNDIAYNLRIGQVYWDGFNFEAPTGADICIDVDGPTGAQVLVGALRTPVAAPFDAATLGSCN